MRPTRRTFLAMLSMSAVPLVTSRFSADFSAEEQTPRDPVEPTIEFYFSPIDPNWSRREEGIPRSSALVRDVERFFASEGIALHCEERHAPAEKPTLQLADAFLKSFYEREFRHPDRFGVFFMTPYESGCHENRLRDAYSWTRFLEEKEGDSDPRIALARRLQMATSHEHPLLFTYWLDEFTQSDASFSALEREARAYQAPTLDALETKRAFRAASASGLSETMTARAFVCVGDDFTQTPFAEGKASEHSFNHHLSSLLWTTRYVACHEIGHLLGLWHTHIKKECDTITSRITNWSAEEYANANALNELAGFGGIGAAPPCETYPDEFPTYKAINFMSHSSTALIKGTPEHPFGIYLNDLQRRAIKDYLRGGRTFQLFREHGFRYFAYQRDPRFVEGILKGDFS